MKTQSKAPILRDYQVDDEAAIEAAFEENRSVLYQLPTGGGKSVVISHWIYKYKTENIIVFAHKRRLIYQMKEHLANYGIKCGTMIGQKEENMTSNVIIVSIRTAVKEKRLASLIKLRKWDRGVIDEARHSRTGSYDTVLEAMLESHPMYKLLGVDATPYRKDRKRLDKHFQYMVVSKENMATLIDKGYLAKYRTFQTPIGDIEEQVKEVAGDFQMTDLSKYMRQPKFMNYIVENYIKNGEGRQAICFAVDIEHSLELEKVFIAKGIKKVKSINSDMSNDEIDKVIAAYESGAIQIIINVEMLTEGVDLPETGCIIYARPTMSLTLYLQMGGRGTRPKSDGSDLIVIDCSGNTERFGTLASPKHWSLNPEIDPNNPRKKNKVVGLKTDGTYTEQIEEFMEVVEMSPEEYMQHLSGGLESAEKVNKSIDEKIKDVYDSMTKLLAGIVKNTGKTTVDMHIAPERHSSSVRITMFLKKHRKPIPEGREEGYEPFDYNIPKSEIVVGSGLPLYVKFCPYNNNFSDHNKESLRDYQLMMTVSGAVNEQLMENRNVLKQFFELFEEIVDLQKSKINLEDFKVAAKKAKREKWERTVLNHLKENGGEIKLPKGRTADNYFKGERYSSIIAIKVPGLKVNSFHNKITIVLEDRWDKKRVNESAKDYVKGDKVWEIIEEGGFMEEILK